MLQNSFIFLEVIKFLDGVQTFITPAVFLESDAKNLRILFTAKHKTAFTELISI